MDTVLNANGVTHARRRRSEDGTLAQSAVRYCRFPRPVTLRRLELGLSRKNRWVPFVPAHPAHLVLSAWLDGGWRQVLEVHLPEIPLVRGEGLSPEMPTEAIDRLMEDLTAEFKHRVVVPDTTSVLFRVECDREHPVWPNHGETDGGVLMVPFHILDNLVLLGVAAEPAPPPEYLAPLRRGVIEAVAPEGMTAEVRFGRVHFSSERFSVGFSLVRPEILHLGWDGVAGCRAGENRVLARLVKQGPAVQTSAPISGPWLSLTDADYIGAHWTGEVQVEGNRVCYRGLDCGRGVVLDVEFTVTPDGFDMALQERIEPGVLNLEFAGWRFAWDLTAAMTAATALPLEGDGRNVRIAAPFGWSGDGNGVLFCEPLSGAGSVMSDSCHDGGYGLTDFRSDPEVTFDPGLLPPGCYRSAWRFRVGAWLPATEGEAGMSPAIRRYWGATFSCYRPEMGGFSNHAASCNCHNNQHNPCEVCLFTGEGPSGIDPAEFYRFTIERALAGGGGYGHWRDLYLDSDPVLVAGAGRIFQLRGDAQWLRRIRGGLTSACQRILGTVDDTGMAVCRRLSGDTGSFRWSSNALDVVGFGHMDGYVNAQSYRAFRNAEVMFTVLEDAELAECCRRAADGIHAAYQRFLLNPETGLVAGWRSRDDRLHDAAYLWVNALAIAYGLIDAAASVRALEVLESLRRSGVGSACFGLPFNLKPIPVGDHKLSEMLGRWGATYEYYTDGSMNLYLAGFYLRALELNGMRGAAQVLAGEIEAGLVAGHFNGGIGSGVEFYRHDGVPTGYEGTFTGSFSVLYALAVLRGIIRPTAPEWWPEIPSE